MVIFIKTWKEDLKWLKYCLQSIEKFGPEHEVVIVCDVEAREDLLNLQTYRAKIHFVPNSKNGYIQQQMIKLQAFCFTDAERILFVDSDCIFHSRFTEATFLIANKPFLLKTRYEEVGNGIVWKEITEKWFKGPLLFEYMRRLPMMVLRKTLVEVNETFPNLIEELSLLETRDFSEFNLVGAYIDHHQQDEYVILNTARGEMPEPVIKQYWSWGVITPIIQEEIESILA